MVTSFAAIWFRYRSGGCGISQGLQLIRNSYFQFIADIQLEVFTIGSLRRFFARIVLIVSFEEVFLADTPAVTGEQGLCCKGGREKYKKKDQLSGTTHRIKEIFHAEVS